MCLVWYKKRIYVNDLEQTAIVLFINKITFSY